MTRVCPILLAAAAAMSALWMGGCSRATVGREPGAAEVPRLKVLVFAARVDADEAVTREAVAQFRSRLENVPGCSVVDAANADRAAEAYKQEMLAGDEEGVARLLLQLFTADVAVVVRGSRTDGRLNLRARSIQSEDASGSLEFEHAAALGSGRELAAFVERFVEVLHARSAERPQPAATTR